MAQVMGRAIRYCSHKRLPRDLRRVDVYIYASYTDKALPDPAHSIDLYMLNIADGKKEESSEWIAALMNCAVDRGLL